MKYDKITKYALSLAKTFTQASNPVVADITKYTAQYVKNRVMYTVDCGLIIFNISDSIHKRLKHSKERCLCFANGDVQYSITNEFEWQDVYIYKKRPDFYFVYGC